MIWKHSKSNKIAPKVIPGFEESTRSADKVDSLKVDLLKSRLVQKLKMEVKFAAAAANFTDFNMKIGANVAGAQNGGELCRGGGKFRRLLHASKRP